MLVAVVEEEELETLLRSDIPQLILHTKRRLVSIYQESNANSSSRPNWLQFPPIDDNPLVHVFTFTFKLI